MLWPQLCKSQDLPTSSPVLRRGKGKQKNKISLCVIDSQLTSASRLSSKSMKANAGKDNKNGLKKKVLVLAYSESYASFIFF